MTAISKRKIIYFFSFLFSSIPFFYCQAMPLESFIAQYNPKEAPLITAAIYDSAHRHHIDPLLMASVFYVESRYDNHAISPAGALGIAQLMPGTAEEMNADPYGISSNIEGGTRYLAEMIRRNGGQTNAALASYNAGPGSVQNGIPSYTYGYIRDVSETYRKLRALIQDSQPPAVKESKRQRLLRAVRKVQQERLAARSTDAEATDEKKKNKQKSSIFY